MLTAMTAMVRVAVVKMRMETVKTMMKEIAAKTIIGAEALTSLSVKKTAKVMERTRVTTGMKTELACT